MKLNIINCFCTKKTSSGNPAAIVRGFKQDKDKKQELARRLNLPVTVFLSEVIDGTRNIEFFYPETEMPLCLHGTIGATYIIFKEEKLDDITFITKDKNILKARVAENIIQVLVSSKSVSSLVVDKLEICKMLNLNNINEVDSQLPFLISSVGSPKLLIPLKSFEILSVLKPNFNLMAEWSKVNSINGLYVYTKDIMSNDLDFYARGFNPKGGHEEDAASGVAAAALSLALKQSIVVGQGKFINRPSKIIVSYDNPNIIWVGGNVQEQIKNGKINFKKINENDLKLLYRWFQIPHVLKWYARDEKYTSEMIEEKYRQRINDVSIQSFIIYDQDKPVGYIQYYHVTEHLPEGIIDYTPPLFNNFKPNELIGIDLFIADENYLHMGFASVALALFINTYLNEKFKAVLADPVKQNTSAISFFERNGFRHILSQDAIHDLMLLKLE